MKYIIPVLLVSAVILASGCMQTQDTQPAAGAKDAAIQKCGQWCTESKDIGASWESVYGRGPCLSDDAAWNITDWVCDIAHNPRQAVDNDPANQCQAYISGQAHHFVEVDGNCSLIRAV